MDKFTDYITYEEEYRPDIQALNFPPLSQFKPLILYGPAGVGKYTQMLQIIKAYSSSQLKVEKRLTINTSTTFYIKMSDIHYEVDMDLLVCNAKVLWDDFKTWYGDDHDPKAKPKQSEFTKFMIKQLGEPILTKGQKLYQNIIFNNYIEEDVQDNEVKNVLDV